jgi:diguanylate cyclase (GGDEF)-like protein
MNAFQKSVFALLAITLLSIGWYVQFGDTRILKITPQQFRYLATDDQNQNGISTNQLTVDTDAARLQCELKQGDNYPWPYCGLSIHINSDARYGLNLSKYHTLSVEIDYIAENTQSPRLRIYLRNFNPEYSTVADEYTHKYNGVEFTPNENAGHWSIPLKNLQVMTWWLHDNNIGIEHSALEFNNVNKIEFATGSSAPLGAHDIQIKSVQFQGAYISGETFYLSLLILWVVFGAIFIIVELLKTRQLLRQKHERELHLEETNKKLRAQNYEFSEKAHKDSLTGALNRHAVQDWLKSIKAEVHQGNRNLCMLFVDIDRFKLINDTYGHQIGDDLLREFSMVLDICLSEDDKLVRWGGEEFVILMPDTILENAASKAEVIRKTVMKHAWVHGETMTCSIGLAQMGQERTTETIARADEALYVAKKNGRNRVEIASNTISDQ